MILSIICMNKFIKVAWNMMFIYIILNFIFYIFNIKYIYISYIQLNLKTLNNKEWLI